MKKILSLTLVSLALVLALVACAGKTVTGSSTSSGASSGAVSANGTPVPGGNTNQPLPLVEQLLVGTFKLEGTANAVDAKEAAYAVRKPVVSRKDFGFDPCNLWQRAALPWGPH